MATMQSPRNETMQPTFDDAYNAIYKPLRKPDAIVQTGYDAGKETKIEGETPIPKTWEEQWACSFGHMANNGHTYTVVHKVIFPKRLDPESGKLKSCKVTLHTLYLKTLKAITDSGYYRITIKQGTYHISAIERIVTHSWVNGRPSTSERLGQRYMPLERLTCMGFIQWLAKRIEPAKAACIMAELNYGY